MTCRVRSLEVVYPETLVESGLIFATFHFPESAANFLTNPALDSQAKIPEYKVCAARFDTPEYVFPAGMVCLGYPDEEPRLSQRLPLEAVMHRNSYQFFDDETIKDLYRERDSVWESVSEGWKNQLRKQGINSIPQALAVQRFSNEATGERSQRILENLRKAKFTFEL
jgi:hypothetical protein